MSAEISTTDSYTTTRPGDTVIWVEYGQQRVGTVETDLSYSEGQRIGGRSVKNIWESAASFRVVQNV